MAIVLVTHDETLAARCPRQIRIKDGTSSRVPATRLSTVDRRRARVMNLAGLALRNLRRGRFDGPVDPRDRARRRQRTGVDLVVAQHPGRHARRHRRDGRRSRRDAEGRLGYFRGLHSRADDRAHCLHSWRDAGLGRAVHVCAECRGSQRAHARLARHELPWKKVPLREGRVPAPGEHDVAVLGDAAAAALGRSSATRSTSLARLSRSSASPTTPPPSIAVGAGSADRPAEDQSSAGAGHMIHVNVERGKARLNLAQVKALIETLGNLTASTANDVLERIEISRSWTPYRWRSRSSR